MPSWAASAGRPSSTVASRTRSSSRSSPSAGRAPRSSPTSGPRRPTARPSSLRQRDRTTAPPRRRRAHRQERTVVTMIQTQGGTWQRRFGDSLMRSLSTPKVMLERGEGCQVWDVDGKRYLDFLAGIAVNALGHAHPGARRGASPSRRPALIHVSNYFATTAAGRTRRAPQAHQRAPANGAGSTSATAGPRPTRPRSSWPGSTGATARRTRILALQNSFHGRTMGCARADRQAGPPRAVRADGAGRRAHRHDTRGARGRDGRHGRGARRRADQGRGRRRRPARRLPRAGARAHRPGTAPC